MKQVARGFEQYRRRRELEQLQFLLRLIQLPAAEFDKPKRLARNLSDKLAIFSNSAPERFKPLRSQEIARLTREIRRGVLALKANRPWEARVSATIRLQPVRKGGAQVSVQYTDDLRGAFLSSAIQRVGAQYEHISECQAAGCSRLFVKRKAGRYCSGKCSQRTRSRRFYEQHREELSDRRHNAYVERIKKEKGAAKKVQRR